MNNSSKTELIAKAEAIRKIKAEYDQALDVAARAEMASRSAADKVQAIAQRLHEASNELQLFLMDGKASCGGPTFQIQERISQILISGELNSCAQ